MKVLKIGGSFITNKNGYKSPDTKHMIQIAKTIAQLWKSGTRDLMLVHGAGSFGHAVVIKHKIDNGVRTVEQKIGFADTHAACSELSLFLVKALVDQGVPAISIPPTIIAKQKNKRICDFRFEIVNNYLNAGYLPILYGDMLLDSDIGGSVCSGDQIMAWLGKKAEFLVFATNVDGVLDGKGKAIPLITKDNFDEISMHLKETKNDVTGAMKGKLQELLELDNVSYIVNAEKPERILALFEGKETICTKVNPKKQLD
ncbi:isopentenyl phosphate kinase family protein [Candidatus Micrarchaeota archaeon]|nr:isopentenyl phosphate kinase family protein [Candidatus Micrarchaeota archaeon]MBU1166240.1 isopentenyl phosphate kinase family protein [Candidatus Micrarchaeota archaeon]MBU1886803.1 isopentenyl phosphate kinase family protein [Candidatus Micrarchaeota archaeon]